MPSFRQTAPFSPNLWQLESTACLSIGETFIKQSSFTFLFLLTKHCRVSYSPDLFFFEESTGSPRDLAKGLCHWTFVVYY